MRLFLGLPVPGHAALAALRDELLEAHARPVPHGTWHVTVRFLGDADPGSVAAALDPLLEHPRPALPAVVRGLGAFSSPQKARILWAGVEAPGIEELHQQVVAATRAIGVPPDDRVFRPHVTLARARHPIDARALVARHKDRLFGEGRLDQVVLYASTLGPGGPRHRLVRSWPLA